MSRSGADRPRGCSFRISTPMGAGGVAIVELHGDITPALERLAIGDVAVGTIVLRDLCGVDTGLVARWSDRFVQLMPHSGIGLLRALAARCEAAGIRAGGPDDPRDEYPEAADEIEALMLAALARAESPLATDLLLDQPRRWRAWSDQETPIESIRDVSRVLNRLIAPATVVAVGRPNVGKSTLVNALARRSVSVVAEEAGATRDHVGVTLDLAGLVVRWIDTPGIRAPADGASSEIERAAAAMARIVIDRADLLVHCGDFEHDFVATEELHALAPAFDPRRALKVATRADLGIAPGAEVSVRLAPSAAADVATGVAELVAAVRERLAPRGALEWTGPWLFDERIAMSAR